MSNELLPHLFSTFDLHLKMFVAEYCSSVAHCVEETFELILQQFKLSVTHQRLSTQS